MRNSRRGRARHPRRSRGDTPVLASLLLAAMVMVLAAVLYVLVSNMINHGPAGSPIGGVLTLGTLSESQSGGLYVYVSTVQTAGTGLQWQDVLFQVQGGTGQPISSGPVNLTTTDPHQAGCSAALFIFAVSSWSVPTPACPAGNVGGSALVASGAQVILVSSANLNAQSYQLVMIGQATYSGSASVPIP